MNNLEGKTSFIFDLDGTLIDSFQQISDACNTTRVNFGFPKINKTELSKQIGLPAEFLFSDLNTSNSLLETLVKDFRKELSLLTLSDNPNFPFAFDFIAKAKSEGHLIGIATSKPQDLASQVLDNSVFKNLIDHIAGTGQLQAKPRPDVINDCLVKFGNGNAFMFGDRPEDIHAARNAGINSVGIGQGNFTVAELLEEGALVAYENFESLYLEVSNYKGDLNDYFSELCR